MTLEYRDNGGDNDGVNNVVAVECTWCGEPLPEQTGYAQHIQQCPDAPQSDAREYGEWP